MALLRTLLANEGIVPDTGGCWRMFGGRNSTSGQYTSPVNLEVSGTTQSFSGFEILPGGDNPDVTDWLCEYRYIGLLYGCTTNVSGCICPSGDCPAVVLYTFDTDGCCCALPCNGDFTECTFCTDYGYTISTVTSLNHEITFFDFNGTNYVINPVQLLPPNIINIGGESYNTAFADTINSIGIPNFTAEYPTLAEIQAAHGQGTSINLRNSIVRFKYPTCQTFFIEAQGDGETYTWTENGYNGPNDTGIYGFSLPISCVNTNEC